MGFCQPHCNWSVHSLYLAVNSLGLQVPAVQSQKQVSESYAAASSTEAASLRPIDQAEEISCGKLWSV